MSDLASIRNTIQEKREEIIADLTAIANLNEETGDWEAAPVMEVSEADLNNEADGVEEWNERNATVSLLEAMFRNHNRALEKIERGTFGTCELCENTIGEDRLLVLTTARTCALHRDDERTLPL